MCPSGVVIVRSCAAAPKSELGFITTVSNSGCGTRRGAGSLGADGFSAGGALLEARDEALDEEARGFKRAGFSSLEHPTPNITSATHAAIVRVRVLAQVTGG